MAAMSGRAKSSLLTRGARLLRIVLHLLRGMLTVALVFPFYDTDRRRRAIKHWAQSLLHILDMRMHVHGLPHLHGHPAMLVANHVSWLDIYVINAVIPVRFVAKSEVRAWPAIGWLSARTGTLFIERQRRRDTTRINREIAAAMECGDIVAVFPEGTTTDGAGVLRFHSSLLQPALLARAHVHPVALRYEHDDGTLCIEAAYDGDKTLWDAMRLVIAQPRIHIHVWFLPVLPPDAAHRRELADAAQAAIADRLKS